MDDLFTASLNSLSDSGLLALHRVFIRAHTHALKCEHCGTQPRLLKLGTKLEMIEYKMLMRIDLSHLWEIEKLQLELKIKKS